MSLTKMLKGNSYSSKRLNEIISMVDIDIDEISKEINSSPILAPYILKNPELACQVGCAFDYLARFVIEQYQNKLHGNSINKSNYIACFAIKECLNYLQNSGFNTKKYWRTFFISKELLEDFVSGNEDELLFERIIDISIYFANLEAYFRGNKSEDEVLKLITKKPDIYVHKELKNQIEIFKKAFEEKFNIKSKKAFIVYNPSFGYCSTAIRGADADIIINKTLIDFKSSKYTTNIAMDYKQILGYYLFDNILKEGNSSIDKICLYFSRYGKFVEYEFKKKDKKNIEKATKEMKAFLDSL